jgi:CHAT domain-containing protein/Tfp pilus assembly protein PilF
MRVLAAIVLLAVSSCARSAAVDPVAVQVSALEALRQGELARAEGLTTTGLAAVAGDSVHELPLRLLHAEILLMRREIDRASEIIDLPVPAGDAFGRLEARRRYLAGFRQMMTGRVEEAAAMLAEASTGAAAAGAADVAMDADILAGQALFRLGRWVDAEAVLARARSQARGLGDRSREAGALVNLGMGQLVRERFDAALGYFDRVLSYPELSTHLTYATALTNAGLCHARLGAFDRALELQRRAVALYESRNVPAYLEDALGELGHTQFLRGNATEALALLGRAQQVAAGAGRAERAALWTDSSATALVELGRWEEADRLNEESMSIKRRMPAASFGPNLINRARIAAGRGQHEAAVTAFELALADAAAPAWVQWQAHAGLASTFMSTGRTDRALRHFEQALGVVENTRSSLLRPEYRISFLSRMIHFHRAYVEALMRSGQPLRALEVADASRARVLAERFGQAPAARVRAAVITSRLARAGEANVAYWLAPERSFAWVVTSSGVHHVELPSSSTIDGLVVRYREFIERSLGDPRRVASAPGDALSAAVLAPVLKLVGANAHVTVVPDGSLHGVNFETLPVGPERRYWIQDVTVSVAPALSLIAGTEPARERVPRALLVIGDPIDEAGGLPRLQFAGPEVDAVSATFPTVAVTVHRGAAATPRAFLEGAPGRYSVIHFAAHATISALSPLDSSIELSPAAGGGFKLYARDIAQSALRADLVTVSACRSAGGQSYGGEGLVGLAWAFMRAGATRVIAGLWEVDDQSTATLMTATYEGISAGATPATALRAAKLRLLAAGGNFAKPYYWAPFQVFTAGR